MEEQILQEHLLQEFLQQNHGMGMKVMDARSHIPQHMGSLSLTSEPMHDSDIDHGSRLAKSLGFIDEIAWPGFLKYLRRPYFPRQSFSHINTSFSQQRLM